MVNWKRPENVPYPSEWHTFQAKDCDSDEIVNYRVQDLPKDRFCEAVDHMINFFLIDEVLSSLKGLRNCPESLAEVRGIWEEFVQQGISLACFKDGSDELVGVNIIIAEHIDDKKLSPKGNAFKQVYEAVEYIMKTVNIFEKFNTDVYMSAFGLSVTPKYRGKGIAQQILAARVPLGKAVGLTCTSTVFTSMASQIPAARAGFTEEYACSTEEYESNGMHFPGIKPVKLMSLKIS